MAIIKSSNLLSSRPTAKKVSTSKFFATSKKVNKTVQVSKKSNDLRNELINIKENVIKIDKLVKNTFIFQRDIAEKSRKEKEKDQRSAREKKLESFKSKIPGLEFPSLPKFDFIESIKRFIFFTFLGAAFPKLLEIVPKLVQLGNLIAPGVKFFADIAKGLTNGIVTFIDWGYKVRDNAEKVTKQIAGENAAKKFDEFNRSLNTFIDLSILAGLTALDVGLDAEKFRKKQIEKGKPEKPRRVGVTEGKGGARDLGRKAEVTTGRGGARGIGKKAAVTVSGESKGVLSNLKGPFAKLKGPLSKFAGAVVPGLGAAVGAADAAARFAAGDKVGGTLASVSAALDALTAGTAILAATGIGAAVPAAFATVSMGIDVVLLIRDIVKVFFPQIPMFTGGGRIKLMAQGGRVGSPGRSIKVSRKKINIGKPQDTRPGKDVGGKQQILKLFPDGSAENVKQTTSASPWWARLFGGGNNQTASKPVGGKLPSPYKAIEGTSKALKKIPIPFISALMGAGSDLNLGQKPDKNLGDIVGGSIGKLTQDIIDNNMKLSFSDVVRFVSGYANGGDIRSGDIIKENDIGYQVGSMVSKVINTAISSRVDEAINNILREITGQGKPSEETPGNIEGGGEVPPELLQAGMSENMSGYLARLAYLETRIRNIPNAQGSPGMGYYQAFPAFTQEAIKASGGLSPRDSNFTIASKSVMYWIKTYNTEAYNAIMSGNFDRADTLLKNTWPSLPGGSQAQPPNIQQESRKYLPSAIKGPMAQVTGGIKPSQIATTSQQGWRWGRMHKGIDLDGGDNSPISSTQEAKVIWAGDKGDGYGNTVVLRYNNGAETRFAHLRSVNVRTGQKIKVGQLLGRQGDTGASKGSHLHFEYYPNGGAMTYEGYVNPSSVKDSYFRYGGNVKPLLSKKPMDDSNKISSSKLRNPEVSFKINSPISPIAFSPTYSSSSSAYNIPENKVASIMPSLNQSQKSESLNNYPSYGEGSSSFVAIQVIRQTEIIQPQTV